MNFSKKVLVSLSLVTAMALTSSATENKQSKKTEQVAVKSILESYSNIALDNYTNTLNDAKALKVAIDNFAKSATKENLEKAKKAWLVSKRILWTNRNFRLSNGPVDAEEVGYLKLMVL